MKGTTMTATTKSIMLISGEAKDKTGLGAALTAIPGVNLEQRKSTLEKLNGASVDLAGKHDVIIIRVSDASDKEIETIQNLKAGLGEGAVLLALTNEETSLAGVRRLTHAGVTEVVPDTISGEELGSVIERLTRKEMVVIPEMLRQAIPTRHGRVVTIAQARGGIGSTLVAVNLADRLLDRAGVFRKATRNRVALVDLDIQFGAIGTFLDVEPNEALYSLAMEHGEPDEMFVEQAMVHLENGLSVLAAPSAFAPLEALRPTQVKKIIEILRDNYDYVVIDIPRALVDWIAPVLELTDQMYLVTDSSVPSIRQARRLIDFYTEDNLNLKIDIVIGQEKRPVVKGKHHAEAAKVLERSFEHWLPFDPRAARESVDQGKPLSQVAGRSPLTRAIARLGKDTISALAAGETAIGAQRK